MLKLCLGYLKSTQLFNTYANTIQNLFIVLTQLCIYYAIESSAFPSNLHPMYSLSIKVKQLLHSILMFTFISNNILSFYIVLCILAELRLPKRASGAPWVRKFGKPSIPENLVMTQRTPIHSLRGREGNQVSARPGEEYVINHAMHLCNPPFSQREIAQEMAWLHVVVFKNNYKDFATVVLSFQ